jgi:hypothetical protein
VVRLHPAILTAGGAIMDPSAMEFYPWSVFISEAPVFTPPGNAKALRADAAEFITMPGDWIIDATMEVQQEQQITAATALASTMRVQHCQPLSLSEQKELGKQKRPMPYATDEEWEHRIAKREKEVKTIKSLQGYKLYIDAVPRSLRSEDDPMTPDPRDRSISKRSWKWSVEHWRLALNGRGAISREMLLQFRQSTLQQHGTAVAMEDGLRKAPLKTIVIKALLEDFTLKRKA